MKRNFEITSAWPRSATLSESRADRIEIPGANYKGDAQVARKFDARACYQLTLESARNVSVA